MTDRDYANGEGFLLFLLTKYYKYMIRDINKILKKYFVKKGIIKI